MASMVTTGGILADIGTDHAYVPIALVQRQKIKGAIAMDINEGPLARAQEHIRAARLEEYIQTRLSDGAEALLPNEADSILIAGMGGELILHILTEGESVCSTAKELILQPQSEIHKVREYLRQHQYKIEDEDMVCEEGKYYPMMRAVKTEQDETWNRLNDLTAARRKSDPSTPILICPEQSAASISAWFPSLEILETLSLLSSTTSKILRSSCSSFPNKDTFIAPVSLSFETVAE